MRTYLAVIDDQPEARVALRFAARRAAKTGGAIAILAMVPQAEFVHLGSIQAAMEEEEALRIQALVAEAAGTLIEETGLQPEIIVREGDPVAAVQALLKARADVAALVLGAGVVDGPGPLVDYFAGAVAGKMPCPVMIIPGGLSDAALDLLS